MSLKVLHVVFISLSVLLALGFALWCFGFARGLDQRLANLLGVLSVASAAVLVSLERAILRELRPRGGEA